MKRFLLVAALLASLFVVAPTTASARPWRRYGGPGYAYRYPYAYRPPYRAYRYPAYGYRYPAWGYGAYGPGFGIGFGVY